MNKQLKKYVIEHMKLRYERIGKTFEDDEYEKEFIRCLIEHNYKQALYKCCTYGCVRYENDFIRNLVTYYNLEAIVQLNNFNLSDTKIKQDKDDWLDNFERAIKPYDTTCEQLAELIFS